MSKGCEKYIELHQYSGFISVSDAYKAIEIAENDIVEKALSVFKDSILMAYGDVITSDITEELKNQILK